MMEKLGRNFVTGSSSKSCPSSLKMKAPNVVNVLVMDTMQNRVLDSPKVKIV